MNMLRDEALNEMKTEIDQWFDSQEKRTDLEGTVKRTTLQIGIFDGITLEYQPHRIIVDSVDFGGDAAGDEPEKASPLHETKYGMRFSPCWRSSSRRN
ncbi:hypothetical protein HMSSN139_21590 [Paenibacillus sp. HMSSN-139]|nr:hypothetical protein HMSSN139_21590 [Paenibacillus sp. HMSSN-139]